MVERKYVSTQADEARLAGSLAENLNSKADLATPTRQAASRSVGEDPIEMVNDLANDLDDIADSTNRTAVYEAAILQLVERYWGEGVVISVTIEGLDDYSRKRKVVIR